MCRNDSSIAVMYFTRLCYFSFILVLFVSSAPQAETSSEITRYTSQREKLSASDISMQVSTPPEVEVSVKGGIYEIKAVAVIDAPAPNVRYVLTDYSHLYRLNPSITESELLVENDDGSVNVRTRVKGCASYFCEELNRVEKVTTLPSGEIYAEIIPRHKQFKSGKAHWQIKQLGERSEVTYLAEMVPDIYIPPVVSKFLVKKAIKKEAQISFANLEKLSSELCYSRDADKDSLSICH